MKSWRSCRVDLRTPAESTITLAMHQVEDLGADVRLTRVVTLLEEARNVLAEVVDERLKASLND